MNDKMTDKDGVLGDAKIGALTQANFSKINTSKQINILQRISNARYRNISKVLFSNG